MENTHTWTCQNDLGMTVQEYASTYKLSYEIRYKEELEGHIKIRKKTKYLDDFAVEFLESHRKPKSEFSDELMKTLAQTLKSTLGSTSGEITISSPIFPLLRVKSGIQIDPFLFFCKKCCVSRKGAV